VRRFVSGNPSRLWPWHACLVIDDDPDICSVIATLLGSQGHEVEVAHDPARAFELADAERFALVITDLDLKTKVSGLDLLKEFKSHDPSTEVLLISGYGTLETAIEAVRAGAFDYVSKALRRSRAGRDGGPGAGQEAPAAELAPPARALPSGLVGRTASMLQVYKEIANAADAVAPVLVIGESGTGKELVARAIHEHGARSARPFVAVNCGALARDAPRVGAVRARAWLLHGRGRKTRRGCSSRLQAEPSSSMRSERRRRGSR